MFESHAEGLGEILGEKDTQESSGVTQQRNKYKTKVTVEANIYLEINKWLRSLEMII